MLGRHQIRELEFQPMQSANNIEVLEPENVAEPLDLNHISMTGSQ